jgi:hypothetical protein
MVSNHTFYSTSPKDCFPYGYIAFVRDNPKSPGSVRKCPQATFTINALGFVVFLTCFRVTNNFASRLSFQNPSPLNRFQPTHSLYFFGLHPKFVTCGPLWLLCWHSFSWLFPWLNNWISFRSPLQHFQMFSRWWNHKSLSILLTKDTIWHT